MKKSCGVLLAIFCTLSGIYFYFLYGKTALIAVIILSVFGALSVVILFGGITQVFQSRGKVRAIRHALAGESFVGGRLAAAIGRMQPQGETMKSPVFGRECVAYSYDVFTEGEPMKGEAKPTRDILYTGMAMSPCAIETRQGKTRLLGFPTLEYFPEKIAKGSDEAPHFLDYEKSTSFEVALGRQKLGVISDLENFMLDVDGTSRRDWRFAELPPSLVNFKFAEKIVEPGEKVVAFGRFSVERQGLVNQMGFGGEMNDLYPRPPGEVLTEVRGKARFLVAFSLAWSLFVNAIIFLLILKK